jgi:hypothetical protein
MGTAKSYKKQDLSVRKPSKKQDPSLRKKADHYWTDTGNRRQSDTEIQKDFQLRFETLGGVGIVSPEKAILKCGTKTRFYGKNINVGPPSGTTKCQRTEKEEVGEAPPYLAIRLRDKRGEVRAMRRRGRGRCAFS